MLKSHISCKAAVRSSFNHLSALSHRHLRSAISAKSIHYNNGFGSVSLAIKRRKTTSQCCFRVVGGNNYRDPKQMRRSQKRKLIMNGGGRVQLILDGHLPLA